MQKLHVGSFLKPPAAKDSIRIICEPSVAKASLRLIFEALDCKGFTWTLFRGYLLLRFHLGSFSKPSDAKASLGLIFETI
jgi:hypothetical protein